MEQPRQVMSASTSSSATTTTLPSRRSAPPATCRTTAAPLCCHLPSPHVLFSISFFKLSLSSLLEQSTGTSVAARSSHLPSRLSQLRPGPCASPATGSARPSPFEFPTNHTLPLLISPARLSPEIPCSAPRAGAPLLGSPRSFPERLWSSPSLFPSPPRCFPGRGEGSFFPDLLSVGCTLPRWWRAGAGPARLQPRTPHRRPRRRSQSLPTSSDGQESSPLCPDGNLVRMPHPGAPCVLWLMPLILVLLAAAARVVMAAGARPSEVAVGELFTYDTVIGRASRLVVDDVNTNHKTAEEQQHGHGRSRRQGEAREIAELHRQELEEK